MKQQFTICTCCAFS